MKDFRSLFRTSDRIEVQNGYHLTVIDYSDAQSLVRYLNDRAFYDHTCSIPHPYSLADANNFIANVIAFEKEHKIQRDWAIRNREGEQIGGIGLLYNHGLKSHRSEFGYWIGKPYWNKGITTQVVVAFCDYTFNNTGIVRLEALVFDGNLASMRVLKKAGFTHEGFLRSAYVKDNRFIDAHIYAKLKNR